jgi:hypothetical protein
MYEKNTYIHIKPLFYDFSMILYTLHFLKNNPDLGCMDYNPNYSVINAKLHDFSLNCVFLISKYFNLISHM